MFDRFGEFDSAEEINEAAKGLVREGDIDSLKILCRENGIDEDMMQAFLEGDIPFLTDAMSAALGKIEIESKELKPKELVEDWIEYIKAQCMEHEDIAIAVRKKGKNVKGCIVELLRWSFKNRYDVDPEIAKAAGINQKVQMGIPGMGTAKKLILDYYRR